VTSPTATSFLKPLVANYTCHAFEITHLFDVDNAIARKGIDLIVVRNEIDVHVRVYTYNIPSSVA